MMELTFGDPIESLESGNIAKGENKDYALRFFQDAGYSPAVSQGIVANLIHESNLDPRAAGDKGASFGIAQWQKERLQGLKSYSQRNQMDYRTLDAQLQYINHELMGGSGDEGAMKARHFLRNVNDPREATRIFSQYYERPGKPMLKQRLGILDQLSSWIGPAQAEAAEGPGPGMQLQFGAPVKLEFGEPITSPETSSTWRKTEPIIRPGLELGGMMVGGALGTAAEPGLGTLAGGGLGYAGGKAAADYLYGRGQPTLTGQTMQTGKDILTGAAYEAGGGAIGKTIVGPVAAGIQRLRPAVQNIFGRILRSGEAVSEAQVKELQALSERFGIDLTVPELTDSPTLKALWNRLANSPGPEADKIARYIKEVRNPQVSSAIQRELAQISPVGASSYEAGTLAKGVAEQTEAGLKTARKVATSSMYRKAFQEAAPVNTEPVLQDIAKLSETLPEGHPSLGPLRQVGQMLSKEGPGGKIVGETNLETLHNVKTGIDAMLERARGESAIDNNTRRLLMNVKAKLSGLMEASSPEYAEAQRTFRVLSKPINDFRFGDPNIQPRDPRVKTTIARIADMGAENVEGAAAEVFKGKDVEKIARTRQWFRVSGNEDAWNLLMRTRLEELLGKIRGTEFDEAKNIGSLFQSKVMPDKEMAAVWRSALGEEKFGRLRDFMRLLDSTRRIVYTNSQTAFQMEAGRILEKGGVGEFISKVPTSGRQLIEWGLRQFDKVKQPHFAAQLTDAMLNPANAEKVAKLQQMKDTPKKALLFLDWLGSSVFKEEVIRRETPEPPAQQAGRGFTILNQQP